MALQTGDAAQFGKLAWHVAEFGFSEDISTSMQYADFGREVRQLAHNCETFSRVILFAQESLQNSGVSGVAVRWDPESVKEIIGDFEATLRECAELIEQNKRHRIGKPPLKNVEWNVLLQPRVEKLQQRLRLHNSKIHFLLKPFEIDLLRRCQDDMRKHQQDLSGKITAVHSDNRHLMGVLVPDLDAEIESLENHKVFLLDIPGFAREGFHAAALEDLPKNATVESVGLQGLSDAFIACFQSSTIDFSCGLLVADRIPPATMYLNLLKCIWILERMLPLVSPSKDTGSHWPSYVRHLEQELSKECSRFKEGLIVPHEGTLRYENSLSIWPEVGSNAPDVVVGDEMMEWTFEAPLTLPNAKLQRQVKVYRRLGSGEWRYRMIIAAHEELEGQRGRIQTEILDINPTISNIHLLYPWDEPGNEIAIATNGRVARLSFTTLRDALKFQQAVTGFKAWNLTCWRDLRVSIVETGKAEPVPEHGALQLWIPKDLQGSLVAGEEQHMWTTQASTYSSRLDRQTTPVSSFKDSLPIYSPFMVSSSGHSYSSISGTSSRTYSKSSAFSATTQNTSTTLSSVSSLPSVRAHLIAKPRLVLFAREMKDGKTSIISVDVDESLFVNPERCHCSKTGTGGTSCRMAVLERRRGDGDLLIKRYRASFDESECNLYSLLSDTGASPTICKLKRISIMFPTPEDRAKFAGTPNQCQCKPITERELHHCLSNGHKGYFGEVKEFYRQKNNEYHHIQNAKQTVIRGRIDDYTYDVPAALPSKLSVVSENLSERASRSSTGFGSQRKSLRSLGRALSTSLRDPKGTLESSDQTSDSTDPYLSLSGDENVDFFTRMLIDALQNMAPLPRILEEEGVTRMSGLLTSFARRLHSEVSAGHYRLFAAEIYKKREFISKSISAALSKGREEKTDVDDSTSPLSRGEAIPSFQAYTWLLKECEILGRFDKRSSNLMPQFTEENGRRCFFDGPEGENPSPTVEITFELARDFPDFFRCQKFKFDPAKAFDHAICLTGTLEAAYATTAANYLEQLWPTSHLPLRALMKKCLSHQPDDPTDTVSLNSGELESHGSAWSLEMKSEHKFKCYVVVVGPLDFALDIGEQLQWLGSALWSSTRPQGVAIVSNPVSSFNLRHSSYEKGVLTKRVFNCVLPIHQQEAREQDTELSGVCWTNLFQNPALVNSQPIPGRHQIPYKGLEISLNLLAELVQSRQVVSLGGRLFMKGFSSLLVATAISEAAIAWHLIFNENGQRMSYYDDRLNGMKIEDSPELSLGFLESRRHIVGWCGSVKEYIGTAGAPLDIRTSGLPNPPDSVVIEKAYLEGGSNLIGGMTFAVGMKDKPAHLRRGDSYRDLIDWISKQAVVFYDADNSRAWLGDGASALLHLVRASIERDRDQPAYRSNWNFDGALQGSQDSGAWLSAIEILNNFQNLNRSLYVDDMRPDDNGNLVEVHYRFRDRVLKILHDLEVLIDYQSQIAAQDGYWFRQSTKVLVKRLMGFDIWDVAKPSGPILQRIHHLQTGGHGWADFVHSIKALVIFGNDFGDLLQPVDPEPLCPSWKLVPKGMDYLCVAVETLKMLHKTNAKPSHTEGEIASGILWCSQCQLFSECPCVARPQTTEVDSFPVQLLLPRKQNRWLDIPKEHVKVDLAELDGKGAVVFGHTPYRIGPRQKSGQLGILEESVTSVSSAAGASGSEGQSESVARDSLATTVSASTTSTSTPISSPSLSSGRDRSSTSQRERWKSKLGFLRRSPSSSGT